MDQVSRELSEHLSISNATGNLEKEWDDSMMQTSKRITDTADKTIKLQEEHVQIEEVLSKLREKGEALEQTFAEIDQVEKLVQQVKATYDKVAESVNDMEKSVHSSTSSNFSFLQKQSNAFQPYFPPPLPVNIYSTPELLSQHGLSSSDNNSEK
ncbi:hypothetical protein O0I10_007501 [Lichtheimia ornata]|uniref:Uncharacterized protein n=1 Tax=Lichtheimia ornata TaxID=688661 RepID=A0AAD7V087_9FUNG|nr:uncharacterized protein O0I10_007501 [Lichtheimia ornata]KAJ8656904.1 hypothetical protein O0I10_007501 [Lichtheimia ornata]